MRIVSLSAKGIMPIRRIEIDNLSDVVVLAGANGVGKTRLLTWIINFIKHTRSDPDNWITVAATSRKEREEWGQDTLDTRKQADLTKISKTLRTKHPRSKQSSSVLYFESSRQITNVQPLQFTWDVADPDLEEVGWESGFGFLRDRFQDTMHSIFRKVRSRRESVAKAFEESAKYGKAEVTLDLAKFPDPVEPFYAAFTQLLGPKELVEPDPKKGQLFFRDGDVEYQFSQLSSGEREVVNIVFDFILRNPKDCIIVFDEPELHLHPELSYKLIQSLRSVGERNQFILSTHSADIISSSLENSVVFVGPPKADESNQAIMVGEGDETHEALRLLGQSIGIVSLGRRIVLIEGDHSSLDKQTYGAILQGRYSNLVLAPSGGREVIQSFSKLVDRVIDNSIWGVEFFMLCDRDAIPLSKSASAVEGASAGRLRVLPRYHLENFFLEPQVIAQIFQDFEGKDSWLRSPELILEKIKEIARAVVPYATALVISSSFREECGNVDLMPKGVEGKSAEELAELVVQRGRSEMGRLGSAIEETKLRSTTERVYRDICSSFDSDSNDWMVSIPGRQVLRRLCSSTYANIDVGRFKMAYIHKAQLADQNPFAEIEEIFAAFSSR